MTEEFNTLEGYANCIKECLEKITHDYQEAKDSKPKIAYATDPIAYAKEQNYFANGSNVGPLITYYQSGIEIDHGQQMGAWKYMTCRRSSGNFKYRAPVICSIKYTVSVMSMTERQADLLISQIMLATPFSRPYYTVYNNQYVLIQSSEPTNVGSVEVGENQDKVSKREVTLRIERAYLDYPIEDLHKATIMPVDIKEDIVETDDYYIVKKLKNGASIMSNGDIVNGKVIQNTSSSKEAFFNYNVEDEDGNVIETVSKGKVKCILHALEERK